MVSRILLLAISGASLALFCGILQQHILLDMPPEVILLLGLLHRIKLPYLFGIVEQVALGCKI